jgi:hypothetical protein
MQAESAAIDDMIDQLGRRAAVFAGKATHGAEGAEAGCAA